jgi:GDP-D-mannose dehydratase
VILSALCSYIWAAINIDPISFAARDYVEGMWRMLQQETPDDFVLATGEMHYVREFVEKSFQVLGVKIE